jgi:hypothetical protein
MNRNVGVIAFGVLVFASPASALAGLQSALQAAMWGHPTAAYDPATGYISFSGFLPGINEPFTAVTLRLEMDGGALLSDNAALPRVGQITVFGTPPTAIEWFVESTDLVFDAGNVVPVGTPTGDLHFAQSFLGTQRFSAAKLIAVPEPAGTVVAGWAVVALLVGRRLKLRRNGGG